MFPTTISAQLSASDDSSTGTSHDFPAPGSAGLATPWEERQQRIYSWLLEQGGGGFAEAYKGAALLMHLQPPAYVRFVCHALRDILNGLPANVTKQQRKQVQYVFLVGDILSLWNQDGLSRSPITSEKTSLEEQAVMRSEPVPFSPEMIKKISNLLYEHEQGRQRGRSHPTAFFETFAPESVGRPDLINIPAKEWKELQDAAQRYTHESGTGYDDAVRADCAEIFGRFETILSALADSFHQSLVNLDAILEQANA